MSQTPMGSDRVREKLRRCIADGQYYEAHQMFRSLFFRYTTARRYAELADLLFDGAEGLLAAGQLTSGWDLASLFVDTLTNAQSPLTPVTLERLERLFKLLRSNQTDLIDRNAFVAAVVKWSTQVDPKHKYGHPSIHGKFAFVLWKEENMKEARYHYVLSQDGEGCAAFLVDFHQKFAFRNEVDLLIAQAVFQLLCNRSEVTVATKAFDCYTAKHPDITGVKGKAKGPPFSLPLLNFVWLLLLAIAEAQNESRKNPVGMFATLVEKYQPSIHRDPSYSQYLDRIGQIFFGVPPPMKPQAGGGMGGFLTNFLQTFVGGENQSAVASLMAQGDSEEEESEEAEELSLSVRPKKPLANGTVKIDEDLD